MRSGLMICTLWLATLARATAQPADCPTVQRPGPSMDVGVDIGGQPGVPAGTKGRAHVAVPMAAPVIDCGEPSAPADVLRGEPGDLLRGPATDAPSRQ